MAMSLHDQCFLDYGVATHAFAGADECGDLHLVHRHDESILIAVVDGLGHGSEAALASRIAVATLAAQPDQPLPRLFEACHYALNHTRGIVMSIAAIDAQTETMTWAAIGNVEALLLRKGARGLDRKEGIIPRGGIVGHRLTVPRATTIPIRPGDLLAFATDGIRDGFDLEIDPEMATQTIADRVLERYGKTTDDALILVGRWLGNRPGGRRQ